MKAQEYIDQAEQYLIHTYNRYQLVLEKGDGVYLYDVNGDKYLDFTSGIAVFALGYNNKAFNDALKEQIDKLIHTSNFFYSPKLGDAASKVVHATGLDRVFFTNSGTEAIEGAIKLARKYAFLRDGHTNHEIISMNHSFHGRSLGALSVTGNTHYQEAFQPLIGGVVFAEYNNFESVLEKVNEKTCAIIMETVQGEGGIYPANKEFIQKIRALCDEKDILLICDEIQCGMGRTGTMYAYEQYGIKPDIVTTAKALGCGVPVGAFAATEKVAKSLVPGDHGTTYGGNPFVVAAVSKVFDLFQEMNVLAHIQETAPYLEAKLDELKNKYDFIIDRRGLGFMQGLEFSIPVAPIIKKALEDKLILINAGTNIIRFVPPLVIEKEHIDEMVAILDKVLAEV